MSNDFARAERHAQGWRLISNEARADKKWIDASHANPALLLVLDSHGDWWAVSPQCRQCAAPLRNVLRTVAMPAGLDELHCAQCGAAHGPTVAGCECVPLMVVDEEIYALHPRPREGP